MGTTGTNPEMEGDYMTSERDTQRGKLYAAENRARNRHPGKPLPTTKDIERYLKHQAKRATLVARYGEAVDLKLWPMKVLDGRGRRRAGGWSGGITMPIWSREEWVVLHEFAHTIHARLRRNRGHNGSRGEELDGGAPHGWQFAAIFLDLVRFIMGAEAAAVLKAEFKAGKVRYRPKRVIASRKGIIPTFGRKPEVTDETARMAVEGA